MKDKHTATPWKLQGNKVVGSEVVHVNGRERNSLGISSASYSDTVCEVDGWLELEAPKANGDRIVACVNALEDIPSAALSSGVVGEMVEVIKAVARYNMNQRNLLPAKYLDLADDILSKLEDK